MSQNIRHLGNTAARQDSSEFSSSIQSGITHVVLASEKIKVLVIMKEIHP